MKYFVLALVLCGAAALTTGAAGAFEIQGKDASLEDGATPFTSPVDPYVTPDYTRGSSLAMPFVGKDDNSAGISQYGNMIPIPAPGIDRPVPAWAWR
jgi:hypothetical protein